MDVAPEHLLVVDRVSQHHHAATRIHDVVVQFLAERVPLPDRMIIERGALVEEVVRADDRRVAARVAAADPALFQRSEEHTSELQPLMRISYAGSCMKHKT